MTLREVSSVPRTARLAVVLALAAGLSVACGAEPDAATGAPAPPASTTAAATEPAATPPEQTGAAAAEPAMITVPDGVGKDYQSAQDAWRASGLVVAPATDATGANRLPLVDSNWVVVGQDLKAGSQVPAGSPITASVKKYSDD